MKKRRLNLALCGLTFLLGLSTFTVTRLNQQEGVGAQAWSGPQTSTEGSYFSSVGSETGDALRSKLKGIISSGTSESYNWSRYESADEAEGQSDKVLLIYSRQIVSKSAHVSGSLGWNREHSFAKSLFGDAAPAVNDNHHIFADDNKTNGQRGNKPFNELDPKTATRSVDSYGNTTDNYYTGSYFMPNDLAKGEVARSTMYMNTRYGYSVTLNFYSVELMLKWHIENPVTNREIYRNNTVHSLQKNRNPYIDHPEWACKVYGETNASTRQLCSAEQVEPTSVSVSPSTSTVNMGSTIALSASVLPSGANQGVTWSSANTNIATVQNGIVTPKAVGQVVITATSNANNSLKASATITVTNDPIPVTGVTLNKTSLSLALNATSQLTATISPSGASNKNVTWTSSDPSVATVSSTGFVNALSLGTSTISVKTVDGNFSASLALTVIEQPITTSITGSFYNNESSTSAGSNGVTVDSINNGIASVNAKGFGGQAVVTSLQVTQGYYPRSNGLALGSSNNAGTLTLNLAEGFHATKVEVLFNNAGISGTTIGVSGNTNTKSSINGTIGNAGSNPSSGSAFIVEFVSPASQITLTTSKRTALVEIIIHYGEGETGENSLTEASNWADSFLALTDPGCLSGSSVLLSEAWSSLTTSFSQLSADAKAIIANTIANGNGTNLEEAVARYIVIVQNYGLLEFIPGINVPQLQRTVFTFSNPNQLFTIVGGLTLLTLVGVFFVVNRKYKKSR